MVVIIFTTFPDGEGAGKMARMLVEKKLAACVSTIKIENSVYRWKGKIEESQEYLLLIKTKEKLYHRVETAIRANHTYALPECFCVKVKAGSSNYIEWLNRSTLFF